MTIPSFNIVSAGALDVLGEPLKIAENTMIVRTMHEVRQALDDFGARPPLPAVTLDLLGHSTRDHRLLRLGGTIIDALDPLVRKFFEEVERSQVLTAMNAVSVRLLGCETGVSPSGQRTLRMLAEILGLPVFGSKKRLSRTHHTAHGFNPLFHSVLTVANPMRSRSRQASASRPNYSLNSCRLFFADFDFSSMANASEHPDRTAGCAVTKLTRNGDCDEYAQSEGPERESDPPFLSTAQRIESGNDFAGSHGFLGAETPALSGRVTAQKRDSNEYAQSSGPERECHHPLKAGTPQQFVVLQHEVGSTALGARHAEAPAVLGGVSPFLSARPFGVCFPRGRAGPALARALLIRSA